MVRVRVFLLLMDFAVYVPSIQMLPGIFRFSTCRQKQLVLDLTLVGADIGEFVSLRLWQSRDPRARVEMVIRSSKTLSGEADISVVPPIDLYLTLSRGGSGVNISRFCHSLCTKCQLFQPCINSTICPRAKALAFTRENLYTATRVQIWYTDIQRGVRGEESGGVGKRTFASLTLSEQGWKKGGSSPSPSLFLYTGFEIFQPFSWVVSLLIVPHTMRSFPILLRFFSPEVWNGLFVIVSDPPGKCFLWCVV